MFRCRGGWTQAGPGCAVLPRPRSGGASPPAQVTRGWRMLVLWDRLEDAVGQAGGFRPL